MTDYIYTDLGPFRIGSVGSRMIPSRTIVLRSERADCRPVGVLVEFEPFLRLVLAPSRLLVVLVAVLLPVDVLPVVLPASTSPSRHYRRRAGRRCRCRRGCRGTGSRRRCRRCRYFRRRRRRRIRRPRRGVFPRGTVYGLLVGGLALDFARPQTARIFLLLLLQL